MYCKLKMVYADSANRKLYQNAFNYKTSIKDTNEEEGVNIFMLYEHF